MYDLKPGTINLCMNRSLVSVAEPAMYDLKHTVTFLKCVRNLVSVAEPAMYDLKPGAIRKAFPELDRFQLLNQQCMI